MQLLFFKHALGMENENDNLREKLLASFKSYQNYSSLQKSHTEPSFSEDSDLIMKKEIENKNNEIMKSKTKQLQEEELAYHNHNLLINEIQKSNEKEMSSLNEKAQSLRKKINFMKENIEILLCEKWIF